MNAMSLKLSFVFFLILSPVSFSSGEVLPNSDIPSEWGMVPEGRGIKMDMSQCKFEGNLPVEEKEAIIHLVSRIKDIPIKISRISTCWPDFLVAAKIDAGSHVVYCVKNRKDGWMINAVGIRYP